MSIPANSVQKNRSAAKSALKRLVLGAMLAAMSVVIGMFCKSFSASVEKNIPDPPFFVWPVS